MRILIVPSWYPTNDSPLNGIFFLEQAASLEKSGHQVQVLVPPPLDMREQIKLYSLDFGKISFFIYKGLQTAKIRNRKTGPVRSCYSYVRFLVLKHFFFPKLVKQIRTPDIIHAHGVVHGGVLAAFLGKKWDIPVVLTEHCSAFVQNEKLIRCQYRYIYKTLCNIDKILVVGQSLKTKIESIVPRRRIDVVGNSVDSSFFTISPDTKSNTSFYFSSLSLLSENKGIDLLIKAFAKSFSHTDNVFLLIGGDGNIIGSLKKIAKKHGVAKNVRFLGLLSRVEVRDLFWMAHVHVSASFFETFGVNMIEALSCGLPVVATNSGGPQSFINESNGILVPKGNIDELSKAMSYAYHNYDNFDPMTIRDNCTMLYDEINFNQHLTTIYNSLNTKEIT